jgi:hypothetical protein
MVRIGLPSPIQNHQTIQISQDEQTKPQAIAGPSKPAEQAKNKKKKFPWLGILLLIGAAATVGILAACKSPSSSNPPEQPYKPNYYTLKVEYIRTEIKQQNLKDRIAHNFVNGNSRTILNGLMVKKDDFHFEIQYEQQLPDNEKNNVYYIYAFDEARWDGVDDGTAVVGNRFILTVVETGFRLELTNLAVNNLEQNPYRTQSARMAVFRLKHDGTLTNGEW